MSRLLEPLSFTRGPEMKNRFMLAPLTNLQSEKSGILSEEEFRWLSLRAQGGFGLIMTCAAYVQAIGKGFPGQLGVCSNDHIDGLTRLAAKIKSEQSIAIVQLHHGGIRAPRDLLDEAPVGPSADEETGSRALHFAEVKQLIEDFIEAAVRAERAGFDGVELHGAHGYMLCQFFSAQANRRSDEYGGSPENRWRILFEIIDGIRRRCRPDFMLGVRLSPERFGMSLPEVASMAQRLMREDNIDFLDMSLWDVFKEPEEEAYKGRSLLSYFTELDRGNTRLGAAGKIRTPRDAERVIDSGVDWIMLGRAAILHYDFPLRYRNDTTFVPVDLPVTHDYLNAQGLSERFVAYLRHWPGFVSD